MRVFTDVFARFVREGTPTVEELQPLVEAFARRMYAEP